MFVGQGTQRLEHRQGTDMLFAPVLDLDPITLIYEYDLDVPVHQK